MQGVTDLFLEKLDQVFHMPLSEGVMTRTRQLLLDYLCVAMAGAQYNKRKLSRYLAFAKPEAGVCTVIGTGWKLALKEAVFLNGLNAHTLDYDDGTNAGIIHLGAPVFSVLLGMAQKYPIGMERLLRAAVLGYETSFTMAYSMQPTHKRLGYHATGTCGVLGAAMALSYALDFSAAERKNAFAAACVSATGMLKVLDDASELKPYNVAKAALLAVTSAEMAKAGFSGGTEPLGGQRGYLAMMTGSEKTRLADPAGDGRLAVEKAYIKPYAACRYCHPAIACAIRLRERLAADRIDCGGILEITVETYDLAVRGHAHTEVPNPASAKMSIPYGVAVGLLSGRAGLNEYTPEALAEPEPARLMQKMTVRENRGFSEAFPGRQTAEVRVCTAGKVYTERVDYPKGEPENPLTAQELKQRFCALCGYAGKPEAEAAALYDRLLLEQGQIGAILDEWETREERQEKT